LLILDEPAAGLAHPDVNKLMEIIKRIHERGIPNSKAEMIGDLQDWFVANSNGDDIPSERSIRRHVDDLWKMLTALKRDENS
ncbi:MAG: hypothetical protein B7Y02_15475, partial [Rhodobacterales bacterium 17-64-5]